MLNPITSHQVAIIKLWHLVNHSLTTYYKLIEHFGSADYALLPSNIVKWSMLGIHASHIKRASQFSDLEVQHHLDSIIEKTIQYCDFVCTPADSTYPHQLQNYADKPPILFGQGNIQLLNTPSIAIIGSRKATKYGEKNGYDFAYYLSEKGFTVISGLAEGIDQAAHLGAISHHNTVAIMATGIDQTYPKHHQKLRQKILETGNTIITEFLPGTKPLQHHFPRRNRLVSGMSLGVVVVESRLPSGSLGTAKCAANQGKTVFAIPGNIHDKVYEGCHELIREGATLVFHPQQIIEDLSFSFGTISQTSEIHSSHEDIFIPVHLKNLYEQLSWQGQDLDQIASSLSLSTAEITAQLMELELLELCIQHAGQYSRLK